MSNHENKFEEVKEIKKKHKRSRHRDGEERSHRDEDEEGKEKRREKKSRRGENGDGDENDEERRRRRRKEKERLRQLEATGENVDKDGDSDDKPRHYKKKESPDESTHASEQMYKNNNIKNELDSDKPSASYLQSKSSGNKNCDDDELNVKIMKPSHRAKVEKVNVVEEKSFVNIWELAIKKMEVKESQMKEEDKEKTILFIGSKCSGKSSIVFRFLDRSDEVPKPTVALEYTYAKRLKDTSYEKEIGNIWDLGSGIRMANLIESVIDEYSLWDLTIALVLDLSKPEILWVTLEKWLDLLRKRIDDVLRKMVDGEAMREKLIAGAKERIKEYHPDLEMMDLFPLPIIIIGSKYDIFQGFESEIRKIICKTLRFVSHRVGAHLQFCSNKQEGSMTRTRYFISNFLFQTPLSPLNQVAHNRELSIVAGLDSFQDIGFPPVADGDTGRLGAKTPMELWKYAFAKHFPQEDILRPNTERDPTKDPQFKDDEIDALRAQKDAEFARFSKTLNIRDNFEFSIPQF